jgi:hypothetical protein
VALGKAMTTTSPPEAAPLADARRHLQCALTALRAVAHHRPDLSEQLGMVHAVLCDQLTELQAIEAQQ